MTENSRASCHRRADSSSSRQLLMTGTSSRTITPIQEGRADYTRALVSVGGKAEKRFLAHRADSIAIGGNVLSVKAADIARNGRYSVTALRETDIPALDYGMTNVTAQGETATAFCPTATTSRARGATVKIKIRPHANSERFYRRRHQYLLLRQEYQALGGTGKSQGG